MTKKVEQYFGTSQNGIDDKKSGTERVFDFTNVWPQGIQVWGLTFL